MTIFIELYEKKLELLKTIESKLSEREKSEALRDSHSKRKPIGCGFTVHPGYGCDNKCLYCYIQDMGLSFQKVKINKLSGLQILYSLLKNKYIIPTVTFLAFGSICDPFHPKIKNKTLEFFQALKILKCPIQFSTKFKIDRDSAKKLKEIDPNMSGLITIVSLKRYKILEPNAPEPETRIEEIKILKKYIKPCIFLRPIIPKINEDEIEDIVNLADSLKVPIVFGIFRATRRNLERLKKYFDISEILSRLRRYPKGSEQINLEMKDIIQKAIKIAEKYNVRYFIRASCHNAWAHQKFNQGLEYLKGGCVNCENNCLSKIPNISEKDILEFLKYLDIKDASIKVKDFSISISGKIPDWIRHWVQGITRKIVT